MIIIKVLMVVSGVIALLSVHGCGSEADDVNGILSPSANEYEEMVLTSSAFPSNKSIPGRYARNDSNISPPLEWTSVPEETQSFALIMEDPDAPMGTWIHWIVFNLPSNVDNIPEGISSDEDLPGSAVQGENSWGTSAYEGPDPPAGTHHYSFRLYALDTILVLEPGASRADLVGEMEGHVLAQGELVGVYEK